MTEGVDNITLDVEEETDSGKHRNDSVDKGTQSGISSPSNEVLDDEGFTHICDIDDANEITQQGKKACEPLWNIAGLLIARRGVILALLAAFLFSVQGLCMKMVPTGLNAFKFVALTTMVLLVGSLLGIVCGRAPLPKRPSNYLWIFLSGMGVSVSLTTFAVAVSYLNVADAVALAYSSLTFICILSWVILKEPLRVLDFVFSFMALAGVVFIARPRPLFRQSHHDGDSNKTDYLIGVAFGIGSALGLSLRTVAYKKVNQMDIDKFLPIFALGLVVFFSNVAVCTALKQWTVPQPTVLTHAAGSGLTFLFGHICVVMSLKLETATMVSIILTFEISFSFLLQYLFLGVSRAWTSYVGSLLLIFASVGITLHKYRKITRSESSDKVQES